MISTKKFYADHILKLVLALSLLRTDPENYLEWGLENRLASTVGGWQLELRAAPLTDYPYANRKAVMPLIEDLARYQDYSNSNSHIQAYLFTHSSHVPSGLIPENNSSENQTSVTISETARANATVPQATVEPSTLQLGEVNPDELFLNADIFQEAASILEQNLADLNEYGEAAATTHIYQNLKEPPSDPSDASFFDIFKCDRPDADCPDFGSYTAPAPDDDEGDDLGGVIEWDEYLGKKEAIDESAVAVRKQAERHEQETSNNDTHASLSSVRIHDPVTAELTQEEMDLIKILATQDIDMGFIPPLTEAEQSQKEKDEKENAEKLKVLLDINDEKNEEYTKDEEPEDDLGDIQYTIDLETGEKILLNISSSQENQESLVDSVFEDASKFAENIENADLDLSHEVAEEEVATSLNNDVVSEAYISSAELVADDDLATEFDLDALDALLDEKLEEELEDDDNFSIDLPDLDETDLDMYIQSSGYQHHHHARQGIQNYGHGIHARQPSAAGYLPHHQSRVPLSRTLSMEQRFTDFPNLFSFPPGMGMGMSMGDMATNPHYASHFPYNSSQQFAHPHTSMLQHNPSLDLGLPPHQPHYPSNLGTAVASSMNLTNSTSDSDGATGGSYKMEHDLYYYSNTSSEMNQTDDFLNPMMHDEGLQHMDMLSEDMCPIINSAGSASHGNTLLQPQHNQPNNAGNQLQTNLNIGAVGGSAPGDRLDASSDSAVSSMGSERVPSLSDGEWNDGSDSAQEYNNPYDYSSSYGSSREGRSVPVAQKKHQMFGKRAFHDNVTMPQPPTSVPGNAPIKYEYDPYAMQGMEAAGAVGPLVGKQGFIGHDIKYPPYSGLDFGRPIRTAHDIVGHNHSYTMPPHNNGATPRPQNRDKKIRKQTSEEEHLTRDEKRARALNIPITVNDIINLPMDEFNERLSKYDLSENQLSLIRDIRRRGKNKVAAQNCRKRKLDQIMSLADEVKEMKMRKDRFLRERELAINDRKRVKDKYMSLYRHVIQNLRDSDGNPCSPNQYSLQLSAEGSVVLVPRNMENGHQPDQMSAGQGTRPALPGTSAQQQQQQQHPHHQNHSHHPHYPHPHQPKE